MGITPLTKAQADTLFGILVDYAGHDEDGRGYYREEFVDKFTTDPSLYRGQYPFSGRFNDFTLIAEDRRNGIFWKLVSQTTPLRETRKNGIFWKLVNRARVARNNHAADELRDANAVLMNAYATGALKPQRWTRAV